MLLVCFLFLQQAAAAFCLELENVRNVFSRLQVSNFRSELHCVGRNRMERNREQDRTGQGRTSWPSGVFIFLQDGERLRNKSAAMSNSKVNAHYTETTCSTAQCSPNHSRTQNAICEKRNAKCVPTHYVYLPNKTGRSEKLWPN